MDFGSVPLVQNNVHFEFSLVANTSMDGWTWMLCVWSEAIRLTRILVKTIRLLTSPSSEPAHFGKNSLLPLCLFLGLALVFFLNWH